jgi:hypothetical protein
MDDKITEHVEGRQLAAIEPRRTCRLGGRLRHRERDAQSLASPTRSRALGRNCSRRPDLIVSHDR